MRPFLNIQRIKLYDTWQRFPPCSTHILRLSMPRLPSTIPPMMLLVITHNTYIKTFLLRNAYLRKILQLWLQKFSLEQYVTWAPVPWSKIIFQYRQQTEVLFPRTKAADIHYSCSTWILILLFLTLFILQRSIFCCEYSKQKELKLGIHRECF